MLRVDLCKSDDYETLDLLEETVAGLGGTPNGDEGGIGVGLNRFRFGAEEVTVFMDAWGVDLAGPEPLVRRILDRMAGLD